jgi:hypothetical protein
LANANAEANKVVLKINENGNTISLNIGYTSAETIQIEMQTKHNIAEVFFGLMKPRKDGSVLYSIPKIISTGKSSHN